MPEVKKAKKLLTNREFATTDVKFQACCKVLEIKNTPRQASKYRNDQGVAYIISQHLLLDVNEWVWDHAGVTAKDFLKRYQEQVR